MPLDTLNQVDRQTANGALAATLLSITTPSVGGVPQEYASLRNSILAEARRDLGIPAEDVSPQSLEKIRNYLSREVDRVLTGGIDRTERIAQMSRRGDLPIGAYTVRPSDFLKLQKETLRFAEKCIRGADEFTHINAGPRTALDTLFPSLFVKKIEPNGKRPFWVIVDTIREDRYLEVNCLWRVFSEVINLDAVNSPLALLERFVDHYGIELHVNGAASGKKMIIDEVIDSWSNSPVPLSPAPGDRDQLMMVTLRALSPVKSIVGLAYAIDMKTYRRDVLKLG